MKKTIALALTIILLFSAAGAEERWILCRDYANVHISPSKKSETVGYLDAGDNFETDGKTRNGFLHVLSIGENGDGWVFSGYVSNEQPEKKDSRYVCVASKQLACRRWIGGSRIKGRRGWLKNGETVKVYYRTDEWSVTSRGYIRSEWLDPDPE